MDSILFKYSQFFENDGGFEAVKKDFTRLGDELVSEAEKLQKRINDALKFGNNEELEKNEKAVDDLVKTFKKFGEAREDINKVEEEFQKLIKKGNTTTEEQVEKLTELDKALNKYRLDLKKANQFQRDGVKTGEDLNKVRVEAQLNIKTTQKEIRKLQKEVLESNQLSKEEQKLLKAKLVLQKDEIENVNDIRERLSALRLVRNQVNITTEEGTQKVAELNKEIDELTELLSDNSDKFIQNKINIGNYEESIVSALKGSELFRTNIGFLDGALASVLGILTLTSDQLDELEKTTKGNTNAIKRFAIAFGRLNKVLKASIIGVVLLAIGALASAFGNTRAGAIRLEKVMSTLSTAFTTFGQIAREIFSSIGSGITSIVNNFKIFALEGKIAFQELTSFSDEAIAELEKNRQKLAELKEEQRRQNEETENSEGLFERLGKIIDNFKEATVQGLANIDRAFQLEDRVRVLTQEIEKLNGELAITQSIADDSTKSLATQLLANEKALQLQEKIGEKQVEIARAQLEASNERVKQNILANSVETENINLGLKGTEFAQATLDVAQARGSQLEISNDLIEEQQQAVLEVIKAENELQLAVEENGKKRREIQRDLFEQNLDLLIDLIDTEKNLSEQLVNDVNVNFRRRVNEFNRFLIQFRQNAQRELDEFTKFAQQTGLDLDFQVGFDSDGNLQVFVNDTELAVDNIVQLNSQLQGLGLNEITINRFREFIVEARNGVRDFRLLNKELQLVGINVGELQANLAVDRNEIEALDELAEKVRAISQIDQTNLNEEERKKILTELQRLEDEKNAIIQRAEDKRRDNRIDAIDAELKTVEEGSQRELELLREKAELEKQIRDGFIDDTLKRTKQVTDEGLKNFEKFAEEVNRIVGLALDKLIQLSQKSVEQAEERTDRQEEQVDRQEERARQGLENTLAFEQKELARREADLFKQQRRQERLEKIKSVYSAYSNYASRGDENPIAKTLRDFSILEALVATFKEGGITGVGPVKTNKRGITVGARHNPNGTGGNLAWHERGEGFFNRNEVKNIGEDNFWKIKQMASSGTLSENFFSPQNQAFVRTIPVPSSDGKLIEIMRDVKKSIDNKPVSEFNTPEVIDGILKFVETTQRKNHKKRTTYIVTKSRL